MRKVNPPHHPVGVIVEVGGGLLQSAKISVVNKLEDIIVTFKVTKYRPRRGR